MSVCVWIHEEGALHTPGFPRLHLFSSSPGGSVISVHARRCTSLSLSLSHTHTHTLALSHGHRSVRDSHGEVEKRLFSLLFLNSEIRIDDTIRIPPHTTLFPMRSETESRFSQVQYGTLFFLLLALGVMGVCGSGEMKCTVSFSPLASQCSARSSARL